MARRSAEFLVSNFATTGGHLGSNLGVVELQSRCTGCSPHPTTPSCGTPATRPTSTSCVTGRADGSPAAPARRAVGVPEPRRVRPRPGGEQPRLDRALLCLRAGDGPRLRGTRAGRGGGRRRLPDRRGSPSRRSTTSGTSGTSADRPQRQRAFLCADGVEARVRGPPRGEPAARRGRRPGARDNRPRSPASDFFGRTRPALPRPRRRPRPRGLSSGRCSWPRFLTGARRAARPHGQGTRLRACRA